MSDTRLKLSRNTTIDAALTQVAEAGFRGLSVRKVAARAGNSRGGVVSQAGSKADLVATLIADCLEFQRGRHERWLELTSALDVGSQEVLAAVIRAFLDEAVTQDRSQSLAICELIAETARKREPNANLAKLFGAEETFWRKLQRDAPNAEVLGWAIANYCRDELPFALALHGRAEYQVMRSGTIARLVQRFAHSGPFGFATGFDRFVTRADIGDTDAGQGGERWRMIGQAIAGLIRSGGLAAVTHRSVAACADIPKSSIAHHFRTREDLLKAGLAEIYRQLIAVPRRLFCERDAVPDMALSITSHSIAVEAARDDALVPFALNLRQMRGEFIQDELTSSFGLHRDDLAVLQAAGMIIVGAGLALHMGGGDIFLPMKKLRVLVSGSTDFASASDMAH